MCVQIYFNRQFAKCKLQIPHSLSVERSPKPIRNLHANLRVNGNVPSQTNNDKDIFINTTSY